MAERPHHPVERAHHQRAFALYAAQGHKRTYQAVAQQMGVSLRSVKSWAQRFHWQQRIGEREAALARQVADQALTQGIAERSRHLKIVEMAIVRLAKGINEGQVRLQMGDLERLIRLKGYLAGIGESDPTGMSPEQLGRFLADHFAALTTVEQDRLLAAMQVRLAESQADEETGSPPV